MKYEVIAFNGPSLKHSVAGNKVTVEFLETAFIGEATASMTIQVTDADAIGTVFETSVTLTREIPSAFLGEEALIDGDLLSSRLGLTAGTPYAPDAGWLKFYDAEDKKIKYISKKPIRNWLSWNDLNALGLVYGQTIISIDGSNYKVRLIKGAKSNPYQGITGVDQLGTHGSEWNRLMYHITVGNSRDVFISEPGAPGDWAQYTTEDLGMSMQKEGEHYSTGIYNPHADFNICQEQFGSDSRSVVMRGSSLQGSVSNVASHYKTMVAARGWRPLLELTDEPANK